MRRLLIVGTAYASASSPTAAKQVELREADGRDIER